MAAASGPSTSIAGGASRKIILPCKGESHTRMKNTLSFVHASPADHKTLTETATTSKRFWGYTGEQMELWKQDLEVSEEYILQNRVVKVFDKSAFLGFFAIKYPAGKHPEIDHLWLLPQHIRKGYGKQVFQYILNSLEAEGHKQATLYAEPNAKGFYDKMGGRVIGSFRSKISGRYLDIYGFDLVK
jgi:ribosomal protein S18 acetylase RimI-like enzyme